MSLRGNGFESILLDLLCRQPPANLLEVVDKLGSTAEFDLVLSKEYLAILDKYRTLFVRQQFDVALAWNNIQPHLNATTLDSVPARSVESSSSVGQVIDLFKKVATVAATFGLIVILTKAFFSNPYDTVYASKELTHVLPDGSQAYLQPGAEITFSHGRRFVSAQQREVLVKGEVLFDVTSDPDHPFYVISDLTRVEVLGTKFKYAAEGNNSSAENIEGLVDFQVLGDTSHVVLRPNDKASFDGKDLLIELYEPPAPIPPAPTHRIGALDLIEILGHRHPLELEFSPYIPIDGEILCNLAKPLDELLKELKENVEVEIEYSPLGQGRFLLHKLQGAPVGTEARYTFDDYMSEISE